MIEIMERAKARFEVPQAIQNSGFQDENVQLIAKRLSKFFAENHGVRFETVVERLKTVGCAEAFETLLKDIAHSRWQHRALLKSNHRLRIGFETDARNAGITFAQSVLGFENCLQNAAELICKRLDLI